MARIASASPLERLLIQGEGRSLENDVQGNLALLKQATDLEPRNARAWKNLGSAYYLANKRNEAVGAFEKSIALDSSYAVPMFLLDEIYLFLDPKDIAKAEQYALAGQKLWPLFSLARPGSHCTQ